MRVFNTFFKIVKKQLPVTMIYVGIFLVLCVMMGSSQREGAGTYTASSCTLVVVDKDKSEASGKLIDYLSGIHDVKYEDYTDEQIQDYLYYHKIDYVLYIEKGYETTGQLTNVKRPGTSVGIYVDNQISMYEANMRSLLEAGYSVDDAYALTLKALDSEGLVELSVGSAKKPAIYYYFAYVSYVTIMIMFFVITPVIVAFNKKGVNERLNVSPVTLRSKNIQIVLGAVIVSLFVWVLFIAMACFMGYDDLKDLLFKVALNSLAFTITSTAMATIVGNFGMSGDAKSILANIVGLALCFLGGVFVPVSLFGEGMLAVAKFMPTYWYINTNDKIFEGGSMGDIAGGLGIELLFALAFFMVAVVVSKRMRVARSS